MPNSVPNQNILRIFSPPSNFPLPHPNARDMPVYQRPRFGSCGNFRSPSCETFRNETARGLMSRGKFSGGSEYKGLTHPHRHESCTDSFVKTGSAFRPTKRKIRMIVERIAARAVAVTAFPAIHSIEGGKPGAAPFRINWLRSAIKSASEWGKPHG
jgi:hypothetical protein